MELGKSRRQRAVRLTDEALRLLQGRLTEEWQRAGANGRLTWPVRASLLQVSVGTAKRILGQMGNDKVVLEQAFAVLGMEWSDDYCEPVSGSVETRQPEDTRQDPAGPVLLPTSIEAPSNRPAKWVFMAGLSLACLTMIALLAFRSQKVELPYDERPQAKELAIARIAYHNAKYADASFHAKKAYQLAYDTGDTNALSEAIRFEGEICAAQGDLEKAIERFRTALTFRTEFNAYWGRSSVLIALAIVERKLNRIDEAEAHLREAMQGMRKAGDQAGFAEACRELGSVAATRGDRASARRFFDAAADAIADRPDEPMHTDIKARKAMLLSDEGEHLAALKILKECLQDWTRRDHPRWRATTLCQIGTVQWEASQREAARQSFSEARNEFLSVGDRFGVKECEDWLAARS